MNYNLRLEVGDPSKDGHNQSETYYFSSNKSNQELKDAYLKSCELTGLVFEENQDIIVDGNKLDWEHPEYTDRKICVEYEQYKISKLACSILEQYGLDGNIDGDVDLLVELFLDFIKLSLPDFEYEFNQPESQLLDITIGYGLFE